MSRNLSPRGNHRWKVPGASLSRYPSPQPKAPPFSLISKRNHPRPYLSSLQDIVSPLSCDVSLLAQSPLLHSRGSY